MPSYNQFDGKTPEQRRAIVEAETDDLYREVDGLRGKWGVQDNPHIAFELSPRCRLLEIRRGGFLEASERLVYSFKARKTKKVTERSLRVRDARLNGLRVSGN
jgi:hypothetical protein